MNELGYVSVSLHEVAPIMSYLAPENAHLFSESRYLREILRRRVATWSGIDALWRQIPVAISPTVIEKTAWDQLYLDSQLIIGTFPKVMRWLQVTAEKNVDVSKFLDRMLAGLSEFEVKVAKKNPHDFWGHASIRLDLFWHYGELKIIEANCTIPAMQAYSDNVLDAWILAGGRTDFRSRNVQELLASLLSLYRAHGGMATRPRIAILHRHHDSQLGELLWIAKRWTHMGFESMLVTPDKLERRGDIWFVSGSPCEIVYRHIFATRIKDEQLLCALENSCDTHIYNPVSAHYESKAFFAVLSHLAADEQLRFEAGLSKEEARAIERRLPWSRVIGPSFAGISIENTERRLNGLVIKRSIGYGGHSVLLGETWFSQETQERLRAITGLKCDVDVKMFFKWLENDQSLWVAQERMSGLRRATKVLTSSGVEDWNAWFDASIFVNSSGRAICHGGVSRVAQNPIVNIGTGGGLAPLLITS